MRPAMPNRVFLPQDIRDKLAADSLSHGHTYHETSIAGLVTLSDDVYDKLTRLAQEDGITMLEAIRRLLPE